MKRTGMRRSCSIFTITGMPKSTSTKKKSKTEKLLNFIRRKVKISNENKSKLEKEVQNLKLELADRDRIIETLLKQHKETNAKLFTSNAPVKMKTIKSKKENSKTNEIAPPIEIKPGPHQQSTLATKPERGFSMIL